MRTENVYSDYRRSQNVTIIAFRIVGLLLLSCGLRGGGATLTFFVLLAIFAALRE